MMIDWVLVGQGAALVFIGYQAGAWRTERNMLREFEANKAKHRAQRLETVFGTKGGNDDDDRQG